VRQIHLLICDSITQRQDCEQGLIEAKFLGITMGLSATYRIGINTLKIDILADKGDKVDILLAGTEMTGIPKSIISTRDAYTAIEEMRVMMDVLDYEPEVMLRDLPSCKSVYDYYVMLSSYDVGTSADLIERFKDGSKLDPKAWNEFVKHYRLEQFGWGVFE